MNIQFKLNKASDRGFGLFSGLFAIFIALVCVISPKATADDKDVWMQVAGNGDPTVVFISGNGNDSSVWTDIENQIRGMGVRTVVYDRAGLGQSPLKEGPYRVQDEADVLEQALAQNGVNGPLLLVAHSYGGLIAALAAEDNADVKGIVFIDALLPEDLNDLVVEGVLAEYTPQFKALEEAAPALAKAVIPVVKAYPETAARVRGVKVSTDVPFIDIVAERTWVTEPDQLAHVKQVHADFVARSSARSSVIAEGASHNVMRDKPAIIVQSISQMLDHLDVGRK